MGEAKLQTCLQDAYIFAFNFIAQDTLLKSIAVGDALHDIVKKARLSGDHLRVTAALLQINEVDRKLMDVEAWKMIFPHIPEA